MDVQNLDVSRDCLLTLFYLPTRGASTFGWRGIQHQTLAPRRARSSCFLQSGGLLSVREAKHSARALETQGPPLLKTRGCSWSFHQQGPSSSLPPSMSSAELEGVIDYGNKL